MKEIDVVIIGAGSAGLSARSEVSKITSSYVVIDGGKLGTTCARVGCMPSKVLIQIAEDFHRKAKFAEEGIILDGTLSIDKVQAMKHVRKLRDRFVRGVMSGMDSWMKTNFISGYAELIDAHTLKVNDEIIKFKKLILGAGTTPNVPEIFKPYPDNIVTTDSFFEMESLPKSIAVIGLGVIGLELGQACSRLNVETIGVARRKVLAGISDPQLSSYAVSKFSEMMNLSFDGIQSVEKDGSELVITTGDKSVRVEKILVTAGRGLNLSRLNIANIGLDNTKVPEFDVNSLSLKQHPHIFIAGDTTGDKQILHEASDEGKIAGYNAVNSRTVFKRRAPLMITFTDPNIAFCGMKYSELKSAQLPFEVGEVSFEGQGRSIVKLKEIGMLYIYGHKNSGKILGAELMGPDAEHLAHLISWSIAQDLTVYDMLAMPFYHPVVEEGLRTALRSLRGKVDERPEVGPLEIPLQ